MATKQVNIDIIAKDKTRQAMNSATKGVDKVKNAVFNLRNAFIGLGAGLAIKSFIDVGKSVESLQIRLKFLFGSVEEGAKAFDVMAKFAGKVPFSLEQIQAGAGSLAIVSKDADELAKMLEITGNVASVTGLDFRTASEQISRSFSAGIASADIFRERGVKDLLGFSAGVTVTTEQTAEAFERVFGKDGTMAGATSDLAKTLEGTLSMVGDKFFNFQKIIAESFFVGLKQEFGALDKALQDNQQTLDDIATSIGKGLSNAVIMAGDAVRFLKDNFEAIKALAMGVVVFKLAGAFLLLATNIGKAKSALMLFSKLSKLNVVAFLLALGTSVAMLNDANAKAEDPMKKLNELFKKKQMLLEALDSAEKNSIFTFQSTIKEYKNQIDLVDKQIEQYKLSQSHIALDSEIRAINTNAIIAQTDAVKKLNDEKSKVTDGTMLGQDASMGSFEHTFSKEAKLAGAMEMAKLEADVEKEAFTNKYNLIQEQDELLAELRRMNAEDTLTLAHETAKKEMEIQKKSFNDNFNLIKSGKAGEIDLDKMSGKTKTDLAMKVGKETLNTMAGSNKKAFALNKAFNIAEGIMNTATGVTKALSSGNIPLAIAIGAFGAVQIATIMSQKYQGRKLGGRMNQGQPYLVGEAGAELVVPDRASNVVPNGQLGGMGKPVTVNFNISTVDARGFNELLVNSRGLIVNMINSAVNEKGNMAII